MTLLILAANAAADGINNPTANVWNNDGINNPTIAAAPPGSCDGTIDTSTGCVQPMLGGL